MGFRDYVEERIGGRVVRLLGGRHSLVAPRSDSLLSLVLVIAPGWGSRIIDIRPVESAVDLPLTDLKAIEHCLELTRSSCGVARSPRTKRPCDNGVKGTDQNETKRRLLSSIGLCTL